MQLESNDAVDALVDAARMPSGGLHDDIAIVVAGRLRLEQATAIGLAEHDGVAEAQRCYRSDRCTGSEVVRPIDGVWRRLRLGHLHSPHDSASH